MKAIKVLLLSLAILFLGCEKKKIEPIPVGEMNDYKDPAYGFKIKYPKEWKQLGTAGKALFCKSQEVANKFLDPQTGEDGAQVVVEVIRYDGKSPDVLIQSMKEELKQTWQNIEIQADQQITVGDKQAIKVPYVIPVTSKANITGYEVYVAGDTALYKLDFMGYGEQYTAHEAILEAMLNSFEPPVVIAKGTDTWMPSASLETYNTEYFTLQYPDNLNFVPVSKGKSDFAMEMRADRLDCSIHIDVFGAKGLPIEKVWEQNRERYQAKATGETVIDGQKAYWVDYSLRKDISSRAYFVVKNDKVIRITLNWYAPNKDIYFTAFEKCVYSMKLK